MSNEATPGAEPPVDPPESMAHGASAGQAPGADGARASAMPPARDVTMQAIGDVSVRLLAGSVPKRTLEALKRTVLASPNEYPWQVVNQVVLGDAVDPQDLAQKALRAHRDWILRGGRETPGKPLGLRTKTFVAKLVAQGIFFFIYSLTVLVLLLLLKHKWPGTNIYGLLDWFYSVFPGTRPG